VASWSDISLTDFFYAFRKAKVDCFYESSIRVSEKFSSYEEKLGTNLATLLSRLHNEEAAHVLEEGLGRPTLFPKRLNIQTAADTPARGHAFFSDPKRAFNRAVSSEMTPEFRMIGEFSVDCHILSALWVNLVGHKYDAKLSPRALASRVRRYRSSKKDVEIGGYHLEALGSFEPYFQPYRKWRDDGISAMNASIDAGDSIIALTLDVGNFYHNIDPSFFISTGFLRYLGLSLNSFEIGFTSVFASALKIWSQNCTDAMVDLGCTPWASGNGGIPIGLSIVRIISNSVLTFVDNEIETKLRPIYYARYVDDLFLVIKDQQNLESQEDLWKVIESQIDAFSRDKESGDVSLRMPAWAGSTEIRLQASKQKAFFLSGRAGKDLLTNIASQIREVSSERRLMHLPENLDQTQSAKALAATDGVDEADSLRRADGLTLRRLGWSILLRSVSTLARDLRPRDWIKERNDFYDFAHEHVIRPDKILEQLDHLPRLFAIAVSLGDWRQAYRMYRETVSAIYELERTTIGMPMRINGRTCLATTASVWEGTRQQVEVFFREALIRAYPVESPEPNSRPFFTLLADLSTEPDALISKAMLARETDWARVPYREHLRKFAKRRAPARADEDLVYGRYAKEATLREFLGRSEGPVRRKAQQRVAAAALTDTGEDASILPFLVPTRPYTAEEIALYLPDECVFEEPVQAAHNWAEYTRAVRGVWVRSQLAEDALPDILQAPDEVDEKGLSPEAVENPGGNNVDPPVVLIEGPERHRPIRLGITSFGTSDKTWSLGASGTPDLSPSRYKALAHIVNQAVNEVYRPDYLILPELALPENWIRTISERLLASGISLISGLDYCSYPDGTIDSSAVLVLSDNRLGYPSALQIRQRKDEPAPGEEENLYVSHGRSWRNESRLPKPIYLHNGFFFGILVCSELQNIDYRMHFQGFVDCVMILSWNKDIETFAALVDSACFDVHAYIALVNNLRYGDSRVRRPAKQSHLRDLCRVRGGLNNQLVVVEIDPLELRAQQSRAKRWPKKSDSYKPAPEGFRISKARWSVPS